MKVKAKSSGLLSLSTKAEVELVSGGYRAYPPTFSLTSAIHFP